MYNLNKLDLTDSKDYAIEQQAQGTSCTFRIELSKHVRVQDGVQATINL